jgi:hypothetical protein
LHFSRELNRVRRHAPGNAREELQVKKRRKKQRDFLARDAD